MNRRIVIAIFVPLLLFLANCGLPEPKHPITISVIPRSIVELTDRRVSGVKGAHHVDDFIVGYRIIADEYIIVLGYGGPFGPEYRKEVYSRRPKLLSPQELDEFSRVLAAAREAKDKEPITFSGDLLYDAVGDQLCFFEGRRIIDLRNAIYHGWKYGVSGYSGLPSKVDFK